MKMTEILKPKTDKEIWDGINCLCANVTLIASARNGFMPGIKKALENGADINFYDEYDGCSALAGYFGEMLEHSNSIVNEHYLASLAIEKTHDINKHIL